MSLLVFDIFQHMYRREESFDPSGSVFLSGKINTRESWMAPDHTSSMNFQTT